MPLLDVSNLSVVEVEEFTHRIHAHWKRLSVAPLAIWVKACGVDIACTD